MGGGGEGRKQSIDLIILWGMQISKRLTADKLKIMNISRNN